MLEMRRKLELQHIGIANLNKFAIDTQARLTFLIYFRSGFFGYQTKRKGRKDQVGISSVQILIEILRTVANDVNILLGELLGKVFTKCLTDLENQ